MVKHSECDAGDVVEEIFIFGVQWKVIKNAQAPATGEEPTEIDSILCGNSLE